VSCFELSPGKDRPPPNLTRLAYIIATTLPPGRAASSPPRNKRPAELIGMRDRISLTFGRSVSAFRLRATLLVDDAASDAPATWTLRRPRNSDLLIVGEQRHPRAHTVRSVYSLNDRSGPVPQLRDNPTLSVHVFRSSPK